MRAGHFIGIAAFNDNLLHIRGIIVTDSPFDEVAFLMDQCRCDGFHGQGADIIPLPHQVGEITGDFSLGPLGTCGADNHRHAIRDIETADNAFQLFAINRVADLAADPAAMMGVRHQHAVTASQRKVGCQRRALVAALFLDHLDQHDLAAGDDFLDLVMTGKIDAAAALGLNLFISIITARTVSGGVIRLPVGFPVFIPVIGAGFTISGISGLGFRGFVTGFGSIPGHGFFAGCHSRHGIGGRLGYRLAIIIAAAGLFGQQLFPVFNGDAVIVGMDFTEGEEALAIAAVFYKCRLQ